MRRSILQLKARISASAISRILHAAASLPIFLASGLAVCFTAVFGGGHLPEYLITPLLLSWVGLAARGLRSVASTDIHAGNL